MGRILRLIITFYLLACQYANKVAGGGGSKPDPEESGAMRWCGRVTSADDLPTDAKEGDCYTVRFKDIETAALDGTTYVWGVDKATGTAQWVPLCGCGQEVHISLALENGSFLATSDAEEILNPYIENSTLYIHTAGPVSANVQNGTLSAAY